MRRMELGSKRVMSMGVADLAGLRDGSTGQLVLMPARRPALGVPRAAVLPRLMAVGEAVAGRPEASAGHARGLPEGGARGIRPVAPPVELAFYRKYTEAMVRRYLRLSLAAGRVPSLMGREMFRGHVTSYRMHSFEDAVIFCHDMESCLKRLSPVEQELVRRVTMQEYSQGEAAAAMGLSLRSVVRQYGAALDRLTRMLLDGRLLEPQRCLSRG